MQLFVDVLFLLQDGVPIIVKSDWLVLSVHVFKEIALLTDPDIL